MACRTAEKIEQIVLRLSQKDILIVLVSGGGSALLPAPVAGISLAEKSDTVKKLSLAGATIEQLNTVRQHLSRLKGGGLASLACPAQVVSLIFSDIIGNDLQFVASGPTVQSKTSPKDALDIISSFNLEDNMPANVVKYLENVAERPVDLRPGKPYVDVHNVLIGDNSAALKAGEIGAQRMGFLTVVMKSDVAGEAKTVGQEFAQLLAFVWSDNYSESVGKRMCPNLIADFPTLPDELIGGAKNLHTQTKPVCLIWGGETTVSVRNSSGVGGRNQEVALSFLIEVKRMNPSKLNRSFVFLCCGTDGQDGPTDAAGAVIDEKAVRCLDGEWQNRAKSDLCENNSYRFFTDYLDGKCLVKTGFTGTNVMDMQVLIFNRNSIL